jgi:antirestriction protein ArdC
VLNRLRVRAAHTGNLIASLRRGGVPVQPWHSVEISPDSYLISNHSVESHKNSHNIVRGSIVRAVIYPLSTGMAVSSAKTFK